MEFINNGKIEKILFSVEQASRTNPFSLMRGSGAAETVYCLLKKSVSRMRTILYSQKVQGISGRNKIAAGC